MKREDKALFFMKADSKSLIIRALESDYYFL